MLVGCDPDKQEYGVRVAIADLRLQADVGESLTQLLELCNSLCLICTSISHQITSYTVAQLTRLRKAIANHIVDIQIALERLGFRHNSRRARIVEQRVFEVIDFRGEASKARNTRWTLRELPRRMLSFGHTKKLRCCLESWKLTSVLCPETREMGLAWLLVVTSLLCIATTSLI